MYFLQYSSLKNIHNYYSFVTVVSSNVKMRKAGTPNPMTGAGKVEHSLVAQTIEEMIGPRLTAEVCVFAELLIAMQTNLLEF